MITLYIASGCTSCANARNWLDEHGLTYMEKDVYHDVLTKDEIKEILTFTNLGIQELISCHSEAYKKLKPQIKNLSMEELLDLLVEKPDLIQCPIIMDNRRLQIGYDKDDICAFLPREIRELKSAKIQQIIIQVKSTFQ